ncbi:MAG TPA: DUF5615 family PIN-like protein [Gemmataceae bacterium]|nr:DUF5615 family PIN-like protein [Gemmataceae bacterium]
MDFLIDASMPRGTAPLIRARGHQATDVRDIGMRRAPDQDIASYAQVHQMAIVSRDFDFADVRIYPPDQYDGIVLIDLPCTATAPTILNQLDDFLNQTQNLINLPGRLAVVKPGRTRLRPKP